MATRLAVEPIGGAAAGKKKAAGKKARGSQGALTISDGQGSKVVASKWNEDDEAYHVEKGTLNGTKFEHHAFCKTQWSQR